MAYNLLATFNQNQSRIISGLDTVPNYAKTLAPQPRAAAASSASSSAAFKAAPRPAPTTTLSSNPAAKAKSQPRPIAAAPPRPAPTLAPAPPAAVAASAADAAYAASILGSPATVTPSITPLTGAAKPIYSAPLPTPRPAGAAAAAGASTAASSASALYAPPVKNEPTGPASSIVRSAHNANVSIAKTAPPTFDTSKCPECGPNSEVIIDPHQGQEVCTTCGLVLGTYISEESEWRTFSDRRGDDPNRVGGPEIGLLADAGLATLMGDSPNGLNSSLAKLQNKSALSANHRQLLDAFRKCDRICRDLSLPQSMTDRANDLYKRILDSKLIKPRGSETLIATCVFMVCKAEKVPRTLKEMCGVAEVSQKDLGKTFKEIKRLGFHKTLKSSHASRGGHHQSDEEDENDEYRSYLTRWGSQLRLQMRFVDAAKTIAEKARDVLHTARDPGSICGAALYIASFFGANEDRKNLTVISNIVGVSVGTIRTVVAQIMDAKASILPPEFLSTKVEL